MPNISAESLKRHQMRTEDIIKGLLNLTRISTQNGEEQIEEAKIIDVLDALLASDDLALIELIPILLSLFAQSGFSMDLTPLFDKYGIGSQQGETLQKFLLITLSMLKEENLPLPADCSKQETLLKKRWGDLASADILELGDGISLQMNRLREVFRRYTSQLHAVQPIRSKEAQGDSTSSPPRFHRQLRLLFPAKQEELILKKLKGDPLTKTEREYYSRVVKKKLKMLADKNLQELAARLIAR